MREEELVTAEALQETIVLREGEEIGRLYVVVVGDIAYPEALRLHFEQGGYELKNV